MDVTPEMAAELILTLKAMSVQYVVAPYEADAQLAYLNKIGTITSIISEDSDLLCFGCTRVIYKLNNDATAIEIRQQDFGNLPAMRNWTLERFRQMCILSGCDYLASPPGIGVITAAKLLKKTDAYTVIKSWVAWGSAIKAPKIPKNYTDMFRMAELTFLHQRVYNPNSETLVPLNPFPEEFPLTREISEAVGSDIEPHIAKGIALGLVNPETKLEFDLGNATVRRISNPVNVTARPTAPLNARMYSTSTAMKLKPAETTSNPKSNFFQPDPSKSGNSEKLTNNQCQTENFKLKNSSGLIKTFAAAVKLGNQVENIHNPPAKKPVLIVSKHFTNQDVAKDHKPEVITIEDDDKVKELKIGEEEDLQVLSSSTKFQSQPSPSKFPKPSKVTSFKSFNKKPLQSKISHHFMKPTIPRLSPLPGVKPNLVEPSQIFTLKRPLSTYPPPKSNAIPPLKKRFVLKKR